MTLICRNILIGVVFLLSNSLLGQQHIGKEYTFGDHQKYILNPIDGSYDKSDGWIESYWNAISHGFFKIEKEKIIFGRRFFKKGTTIDINGTPSTKAKRSTALRLKILEYQEGRKYTPDKFSCDSKLGKLDILISKDKKYITIEKDSLNWVFHLDYYRCGLRLFVSYKDVTKKTSNSHFTPLNSLDVLPSYKGGRTIEQSSALFLADLEDRLRNNPGIMDSCSFSFSISTEEIIENAQVVNGGSDQFIETLLAHLKYLQYWQPGVIDKKQVETILKFDIQIN